MPAATKVNVNAFGEHYLPVIHGDNLTAKSYSDLFREQFAQALAQEETCHFTIGTDSGQLIRQLLKQGPANDSIYIFIEHTNILPSVIELLADVELPPQVIVCELADWEELCKSIDIAAYIIKQRFFLHRSLAACDVKFDGYHQLDQEAKTTYELKVYETQGGLDTRTFIATQLLNLSENSTPVSVLRDQLSDYSCVIMGAGPSLDNDLAWIKQHRDQLLVIAVSRIAEKLLAENLTPDIVIAIDPGNACFDTSCTMLNMDKDVLFTNAYHVNPRLLAQWHGRNLYIGEGKPWADDSDKGNIHLQGPTVSHAAITMADALGCKIILLSGVDMCYSQSGVSHTSGTAEGDAGINLTRSAYWIDTYRGEKARTSRDLLAGINVLKEVAKTITSTGTKLYNLSPDAARIEHIQLITQDDIRLTRPSQAAKETLLKLAPHRTQHEQTQYNQQLLEQLQSTKKQLKDVVSLCQQALEYNTKLFNKSGKDDRYKFKHKIDKIQSKLDNKYQHLSTIIKNYGLKNFFEFINPGDMTKWSDEKIELHGKHYYDAYILSCKDLDKEIESSIQRTKSRLEEAKTNLNFENLLEQWKKDHQEGRALLWKSNHEQQYNQLNTYLKNQCDSYIAQYYQAINHAKMDYKERRAAASQEVAYNDILKAFKKKDLKALTQTINHYPDSNSTESQNIKKLAQACALYLQASYAESLRILSTIDEEFIKKNEMELALQLAIALKDAPLAEHCLEKLSTEDAEYIPQYAKTLAMNRKYEQAVVTYTNYLQDNPTDIDTWRALADMYLDIGEHEMASQIQNFLQQNP